MTRKVHNAPQAAHPPPPPAPLGRIRRPAIVVPHVYKKGRIPKALRETLWLTHCGKQFEAKCSTPWCQNQMTVYDFQAGHRVPEVKGGATVLENLVPLCSRCNLSMGSSYTFDEWRGLQAAPALPSSRLEPPGSFWCCGDSSTVVEPQPLTRPTSARPVQSRIVVVSNPATP
jgi:hypothetical protein